MLNEEIVAESLYWRAIGGKRTGTVFEREYSEITLGPSMKKKNVNLSVNPKMPYLSFLAINYDISLIAEVQIWFAAENSNHESEIYSLQKDQELYERERKVDEKGLLLFL